MTVHRWLRTDDAARSAVRRAGRAAIVTPGIFAVADKLIGNPTLALFAAFGSLAMLLFVDFGGSMRERLAAQAGLVSTGAILVCLGTIVSQVVWLAVGATLAVAFVVLFAGVVSSVLARATTALLVSFVLPVTLPGPPNSLPDRLAGWLLAGVVSLVAIAVLWPAPAREPLRLSTAQACALLARRLRVEVDCVRGGFEPERGAETLRPVADEATGAVAALRTAFFDTPYRPAGLTTSTRTLVRLVDQVVWLDAILGRMRLDQPPGPTDAAVCEVKAAAATLLERGAALLESAAGSPHQLAPDLRRLQQARETMEQTVTSDLPMQRARTSPHDSAGRSPDTAVEFVNSLAPSFRAQEMSFVISLIAANIELTVVARRRSWWQQLSGRRPQGVLSSLSGAQEPAVAHVERHSVWLHNSVRGAIALGLAVLVAELSGVQHSFWVVLGTLAVLGSNAMNTGQNALRGLLGTVVGFVIGGGIVFVIGANTTVFWLLLPPAVAFAGLAPAVISFAAGQAGFTVVLLILYNIIEPAGWQIGLVRIEDVAIGCAVSVVVGALLWPRGAVSALGQALAEAFSDSAHYLRGAIEYGITRCDPLVSVAPAPRDESRRAAAAALRLDDAFRGFLAERGTKHIGLADVTALVTAVTVLRLTADAILDLWARDGQLPTGDRTAARTEILGAGTSLVEWYERTARALAGSGAVPDRLTQSAVAGGRLVYAVRHDLSGEDGRATATAVRMIWTADHLDVARLLQPRILAPARATATVQGAHRSWLATVGGAFQ